MTSINDLVDANNFPHRPIDLRWADTSQARALELIARYHRAIRDSDESIAMADEMWNGLGKEQPEWARLHYMYGGRSALKCIIDALITADVELPKSILDFPSAHGRVTRFLTTAFPESELWAGDLNKEGVDFCVDHFGAKPFYSAPDLVTITLPRKFDLIWCGSLASHLPEPQNKALFALLLSALKENGILCITTCGRGMQYAHENIFKTIDEPSYERICAELATNSFGYAAYSYRYAGYDSAAEYGMAFLYPAWIERNILNPTIQVLQFREKAWHGAQDVWCFLNRPISAWYNWAHA